MMLNRQKLGRYEVEFAVEVIVSEDTDFTDSKLDATFSLQEPRPLIIPVYIYTVDHTGIPRDIRYIFERTGDLSQVERRDIPVIHCVLLGDSRSSAVGSPECSVRPH